MSENLNVIYDDENPALLAYIERMDQQKRKRIANGLKRLKTGLHAVAPLNCPGPEKCPFLAHCPIPDYDEDGERIIGEMSDYPVGLPCILETSYFRAQIVEYINFLKIDKDNPIEMSVANDLALIDLYKQRATMILSSGDKKGMGIDFLLVDSTSVENGHGEEAMMQVSTTTQVHPALAIIDQLEKRRQKIIESFGESRKIKNDIALKAGKMRENNVLLEELKSLRLALQNKATTSLELEKQDEKILLMKE